MAFGTYTYKKFGHYNNYDIYPSLEEAIHYYNEYMKEEYEFVVGDALLGKRTCKALMIGNQLEKARKLEERLITKGLIDEI